MPVPDYQSLMLPVLRLASEGETRVPDIEGKLADEFGLTNEEREQLLPPSGLLLLGVGPFGLGRCSRSPPAHPAFASAFTTSASKHPVHSIHGFYNCFVLIIRV